MKPKKRKAGRPKLPKSDVKQVVAIRLTEAKKREYEGRASSAGLILRLDSASPAALAK